MTKGTIKGRWIEAIRLNREGRGTRRKRSNELSPVLTHIYTTLGGGRRVTCVSSREPRRRGGDGTEVRCGC